jgi:hypothetical protein
MTKEIEKELLDLLKPSGFDKLFYKFLGSPEIKTQAKAYEKTEEAFEEFFGRRKYASFNSFRNARNKRLKN